MEFENIGGVEIYRPSINAELAIRNEVENKIRSVYGTGTYTEGVIINQIIQDYFDFYDKRLKSLLPKIASLHLMEFVLDEYDKSCDIEKLKNTLDYGKRQYWSDFGPIFRRALKYLAECISILAPDERPSSKKSNIEIRLERCWICCEQLVSLSMQSTQTFALFPNETTLVIHPRGYSQWFELRVKNAEQLESFSKRIDVDTATRNNVIDEDDVLFNKNRISRLIDPQFENDLGLSFTDICDFAYRFISQTNSGNNFCDIPFVNETHFINYLTSNTSLTPKQSKIILDGLCLRKSKMLEEGRVIWKPKQEYRAYSRPFFEFPHSTGPHFIWSRGMAYECMKKLKSRVVQKQIPPEWDSDGMNKALGKYEQEVTTQFENIVIQQLTSTGISASRFKSHIGSGAERLEIPNRIGEIDLIGYWEKEELLIVGEAKLVKPALEPTMFRDDIDKFIGRNKSYVNQVKRKMDWVINNYQVIVSALRTVMGFPDNLIVKKVSPLIVTYYPAFASCFISDVTCVSLSELISDITEHHTWPYSPVHDVGA